jgi:hypothetical protein
LSGCQPLLLRAVTMNMLKNNPCSPKLSHAMTTYRVFIFDMGHINAVVEFDAPDDEPPSNKQRRIFPENSGSYGKAGGSSHGCPKDRDIHGTPAIPPLD